MKVVLTTLNIHWFSTYHKIIENDQLQVQLCKIKFSITTTTTTTIFYSTVIFMYTRLASTVIISLVSEYVKHLPGVTTSFSRNFFDQLVRILRYSFSKIKACTIKYIQLVENKPLVPKVSHVACLRFSSASHCLPVFLLNAFNTCKRLVNKFYLSINSIRILWTRIAGIQE